MASTPTCCTPTQDRALPCAVRACLLGMAFTAMPVCAEPLQPIIRSIDAHVSGAMTQAEQTAVTTQARTRRVMCAWPLSCPEQPPRASQGLRDNPNVLDYASEIASASMAWGVESALIRAVIHAESAFNPNAVSPKGAQGLMQLMPQTASRFGVTDSFDPEQNINGGTRYLAWLLTRFDGNERLAVAAYNAGEGAVDRHEGVPPYQETRSYVDRVERLVGVYRQSVEGKTTASNAPVATQVNGPV